MRGKRAPELAAGEHIHNASGQLWEAQIGVIMEELQDVTLTAEQWARVQHDLQAAKVHLRTLLQLKTDFAKRLPFFFAILAHQSEEVARDGARRILDMLDREPDPSSHHRITAQLMSQDGFLAGVRGLAEGQLRESLAHGVLQTIAGFRFIPIAETTIEEKHSRLALQLKRHGVKPVRVSLSNRQPLLELIILCEPDTLQILATHFSQARRIVHLPDLLGVEGHPELVNVPQRQCKMSSALGKVLYRSDLSSMF